MVVGLAHEQSLPVGVGVSDDVAQHQKFYGLSKQK